MELQKGTNYKAQDYSQMSETGCGRDYSMKGSLNLPRGAHDVFCFFPRLAIQHPRCLLDTLTLKYRESRGVYGGMGTPEPWALSPGERKRGDQREVECKVTGCRFTGASDVVLLGGE